MILMASVVLTLTAASGLAATPAGSYSGDEALNQLAASHNVSKDDIVQLRAQGWSWNELGDALAVAKRSGRSLQDVAADRDSGLSWARISEKSGFEFQSVSSDARHAARQAKKADEQRRPERKPEEPPLPSGPAPGVPPGMQQTPPPAP